MDRPESTTLDDDRLHEYGSAPLMTPTTVINRRIVPTLRELVLPAAAIALALWVLVVAVRGWQLALVAFGLAGDAGQPQDVAPPRLLLAALVVYLFCLLATLAARYVAPRSTLAAACAAGGVVVGVGAVGTRSLAAVLIALVFLTLAWGFGRALLRLLPPLDAPAIVRVPIALALGLGVLGTLLLALGMLSLINTATVLGGAIVLAGAIAFVERDRHPRTVPPGGVWRFDPPCLTWFETVVVGLTVGFVAFALLWAFVPETLGTASDVTRQHLPIAREIWQSGSAAIFPPLGSSSDPMQGHLYYAVAYGLGGAAATKLLQAGIAVVTIAGVGGVGWLGGGRLAAVVSAAVFATVPLALWVFGHVHSDLIAVLLLVAATLCVLLWQRDGEWRWLPLAGVLAGFAFATKLGSGLVIAGMALGLLVVGRAPWHWRDRALSVVAFGLGAAAAMLPWFVRSLSLKGTVPGWGTMLEMLDAFAQRPAADAPAAVEASPTQRNLGIGRSPTALLRSPWTLTFDGAPSHYRVIQAGEMGLTLLMLVPLTLLGPRTRAVAFLTVTAIVSFVGWVFTIQVPRHLLPTLAIAAALAGIGVSHIMAERGLPSRQTLAVAGQLGVVAALVAVPLFYLPAPTTRLPVGLIVGQESAHEYVERVQPTTAIVEAADAVLPPDTRLGYISLWEGPQSFTQARLWPLGSYSDDDRNFLDNQLGTTPEAVLNSLKRLGIGYFIWDKATTRPEDFRSALLSGSFLRDHTRILTGNQHAYLFEVLPEGGKTWGLEQPRNFIRNTQFKKLRRDESGWKTTGKVKKRNKRDSGVYLGRKGSLAQDVPITPGVPYILAATGACNAEGDRVDLTIRWLNADGATVGSATDRTRLGVDIGDAFVWHRAPADATSASLEVAIVGGARCTVQDIALYATPSD